MVYLNQMGGDCMSLIKCPECGKEISDKAVSCPNCGYSLQNRGDENDNEKMMGISIGGSLILYFNSHLLSVENDGEIKVKDELISYNIIEISKDSHPALLIGHESLHEPLVIKKESENLDSLNKLTQYYNIAVPEKVISPTKPSSKAVNKMLHCPKCKSSKLQYLGQETIGARPEKTKTTTSLNLNPLKPFTLFNQKEKVVKKAKAGIDYDRWRCEECGKVFTTMKY